MGIEDLIGTMIQGTLSGGRKRSHRANRYLRGGRGSFLTASTLLTVGGLVWGAIETMQQQKAAGGTSPSPDGSGATPPRPVVTPGYGSTGSLGGPPPLPGTAAPAASVQPAPPIPVAGAPVTTPVPEGAAKLVRLMVAAARADGALTESEQAAILEHARNAGAEALVAAELDTPSPLAAIVAGVEDEHQRSDLYVLAYTIVRADESVSGSERIFLAQLASLLGLDPELADRLERDAAAGIDRA